MPLLHRIHPHTMLVVVGMGMVCLISLQIPSIQNNHSQRHRRAVIRYPEAWGVGLIWRALRGWKKTRSLYQSLLRDWVEGQGPLLVTLALKYIINRRSKDNGLKVLEWRLSQMLSG